MYECFFFVDVCPQDVCDDPWKSEEGIGFSVKPVYILKEVLDPLDQDPLL